MSWDAIRFTIEQSIPAWTEGKNVRPGWVHIQCPMCPDHSNHGGFNPETGGYVCWRCGPHSTTKVISRLLSVREREAESIWKEYHTETLTRQSLNDKKVARATGPLVLPGAALSGPHKKYIQKRGFDPDYLVHKYGILGTGPICDWEGSDFRLRIIIPIHDHLGRLVNFQGRDITGQQELRYKGCPIEKSLVHHKHLLYGAHLAKGPRVVVVEGVFDQWRLGDGFVCSFGTSMTDQQVKELSRWEHIIFLFDPEPEAQAKARAYASELSALGRTVEVAIADFGNGRDPGDLTEAEAQAVRKELLY